MTPDDVNSRGHAGTWKAELLRRRAAETGQSMAALWRQEIAGVALCVPAVCTEITNHLVEYRFADGSTDTYRRTPT